MAPAYPLALKALAQDIKQAGDCYVLTGAGVSVASGIPDFRSDSGLWSRFPPRDYGSIDAFVCNPDKVWEMFRVVGERLAQAKPNSAHQVLARLERRGLIQGLVTQNIDGLHQAAGSRQVLDIHGNATRLHCLGCGNEYSMWRRARSIRQGQTPRCRCGNALKPKVVLFGEQLSLGIVDQARGWMRAADVLLLIGTSAEVAPASELPILARAHGAQIYEFNLVPTGLSERLQGHFIQGPAELRLLELEEILA